MLYEVQHYLIMAKTPAEFEKEFVLTAKEKTGRSVEEWLPLLKASGLEKQMELLNWMKKEHGLNHLQANLLAGMFRNGGKPVYGAEDDLLAAQFNKCDAMKPLYAALSEKLLAGFPGARIIPKKTYVSFNVEREFAALNIKPAELRLGLDLGTQPFEGIVQKTKLTGPMPRISHMIVLKDINDLSGETQSFIQQSYERSHKK